MLTLNNHLCKSILSHSSRHKYACNMRPNSMDDSMNAILFFLQGKRMSDWGKTTNQNKSL